MKTEYETDSSKEIRQSGSRKKYFLLFKIFVSLLLLIYLYTSVQFIDIYSTLILANPFLIVLSAFLVIPNVYLQFVKWKLICYKILGEKNDNEIWLSLFYGYSGGIATPFRLGEYIGRTMAFKNKGVIEVSAATLLDKLFVLLTVIFVGAIASVIFLQFYYSLKLIYALLFYAGLAVIFLMIIYIAGRKELLRGRIISRLKELRYISDFSNTLLSVKKMEKSTLFHLVITTFILCGVFISQFALLTAAYANQNDYMNFLWAGSLVMFIKTLVPPITLGELGVREGASIFILTKMGLNSAIALNASLTLFTINILLPSLAGLVLVLSNRKAKK